MKKILLTLFALLTTTLVGLATDTYKLVTSIEEITVGGKYILYGPATKPAVMTPDISGSKTPFMVHVELASAWGETVEVDGTENYAILELRESTKVVGDTDHTGHYFFYVTNEGSEGYLTDQPSSSNSLQTVSTTSELTTLNNCHLTFDEIDSQGNIKITFNDTSGKNVLCYNASTPRFAGYAAANNSQILPRLYKLQVDDREELFVTTPIEEGFQIDMKSEPLTIFKLTNQDATAEMFNAISVEANEAAQDEDYTLTFDSDNNEIKVVFNNTGEYSFAAFIENNDNYRMSQVNTPVMTVLDPNVKPDAPLISPETGRIFNDTPITITGNGTIYYTIDGVEPTAEDGIPYTEPFFISTAGDVTVKAIVVSGKNIASDVTEVEYTVPNTATLTIDFVKGSGDGKNMSESTPLTDVVESGLRYVESITDPSTVYNASINGIKMGTGSKEGAFTVNLKKPVEIVALTVNAASYNTGDGASLQVYADGNPIGSEKLNSQVAKELEDYVYDPSNLSGAVSSLTLSTDQKRAFVSGLTIKYTVNDGDEELFPKLTVDDVELSVPEETVETGEEFTVNLTPEVLPGEVTVKVNDEDASFENGSMKLSFKEAGEYTISVAWTGNDDYSAGSVSAKVVVKAPIEDLEGVELSAAETAKVNDEVEFTVVLPDGVEALPGEVSIFIDDEKVEGAEIKDGKFSLKFDKAGKYVVMIGWEGNDAYNLGFVEKAIKVETKELKGVAMTAVGSGKVLRVNEDIVFTITLPEGIEALPGEVSIFIDDEEVEGAEIKDGKFSLKFDKAGKYVVKIRWEGNDEYDLGYLEIPVSVEKKDLEGVTLEADTEGITTADEVEFTIVLPEGITELPGEVSILVNGELVEGVEIVDGKFTLDFKEAGEYSVMIGWEGNEEYNSFGTEEVDVEVAEPVAGEPVQLKGVTANATPAEVVSGNEVVVSVTLPEGIEALPGEVTVTVKNGTVAVEDEFKYNADEKNVKLSLEEAGTYTVAINWAGNDDYKPGKVEAKFTVKAKAEFDVKVSLDKEEKIEEVLGEVIIKTILPEGADAFPGEVTYTLTNQDQEEMTLDKDYKMVDVKEGLSLSIDEAGTYTMTISWAGDDNYKAGSVVAAAITVYTKAYLADNGHGVKFDSEGEMEFVNGHFIFAAGAKDHQLKLSNVGEKVEVYYHVEEHKAAATPAEIAGLHAPAMAEETVDTSLFTKYEGEVITLHGEDGYISMFTKKNGVESPVEKAIYTNDVTKIGANGDITTGIMNIDADADVIYFDLNGHRVADRRLVPGIYIRVANGEACKIMVK